MAVSTVTTPLSSAIVNYQQALNCLTQFKQKYDLMNLLQLATNLQANSQNTSSLANIGFFFASRTFHKVFDKNIPVEKIRNLTYISILFNTLSPNTVQSIFPGMQSQAFQSKEGLAALRQQLQNREDYQEFQKTEWKELQDLKSTKGFLKEELITLIQHENISRDTLKQYTQDKKIIKLGVKIQ